MNIIFNSQFIQNILFNGDSSKINIGYVNRLNQHFCEWNSGKNNVKWCMSVNSLLNAKNDTFSDVVKNNNNEFLSN